MQKEALQDISNVLRRVVESGSLHLDLVELDTEDLRVDHLPLKLEDNWAPPELEVELDQSQPKLEWGPQEDFQVKQLERGTEWVQEGLEEEQLELGTELGQEEDLEVEQLEWGTEWVQEGLEEEQLELGTELGQEEDVEVEIETGDEWDQENVELDLDQAQDLEPNSQEEDDWAFS